MTSNCKSEADADCHSGLKVHLHLQADAAHALPISTETGNRLNSDSPSFEDDRCESKYQFGPQL